MRLRHDCDVRQLDISYDSFIRTTDAKHEVRRPLWARGRF